MWLADWLESQGKQYEQPIRKNIIMTTLTVQAPENISRELDVITEKLWQNADLLLPNVKAFMSVWNLDGREQED